MLSRSWTSIYSVQSLNSLARDRNSVKIKNVTQMVIASVFMDILGQMPYSLLFILSLAGVKSPEFKMAMSLASFLVLVPPTLDFISYYFFNRLFQKTFNGYVGKIKKCLIWKKKL